MIKKSKLFMELDERLALGYGTLALLSQRLVADKLSL